MVTVLRSFLRTGDFAAGDQKLALGVLDVRDLAGDGRAVDVDVENVQENADAGGFGAIGADEPTTLPSAGETATGPSGMVRSGSRKK